MDKRILLTLHLMTPEQRDVFILRLYGKEGGSKAMRHKEIAAKLGISEKAVKQRYSRAKKRVKYLMKLSKPHEI